MPVDWQWEKITPRDGQYLRYGWVSPQNAQAVCVIFPGLSEYCEKYSEVASELLSRNFAVAVIDWRGQGRSWRHLPDRDKRHNDDFATDAEDAQAFMATLMKTPALAKLPRIILAHSMGGYLALRTLHDAPDSAICMVTTAPMFGINLPIHMEGPARLTAEAACKMGWSERYVFGAGPWSMPVFTSNLNLLTSDPDRRTRLKQRVLDDPEIRMGGLTFGWVRSALMATRLTHDPKWLSEIHTPVLVVMPEREMIVSNAATKKGVKHMPNAELLEISGSLHEVLMEKDDIRSRFWAAFDGFVAKHLAPR